MPLQQETRTYEKSPTECYQAMLALLPQHDFKIVRRRDIGWLIQAEKPAEKTRRGVALAATIVCRLGVPTRVTITCELRANDATGEEKIAVESLFDALSARLT